MQQRHKGSQKWGLQKWDQVHFPAAYASLGNTDAQRQLAYRHLSGTSLSANDKDAMRLATRQ